jgi:DNA polymerase-3 subunit gamma/tau
MAYQVFARKYRPKTFEEMIGQKAVVQTLQNAVKTGRIAQAYIFSGMRGVGKTTAARILAKALNCQFGPTATPCNHCEYCDAINEDRSIDYLEIDGASNRKVEEIDPIRDTAKYRPIHSRYKIIYIDEVHMLSTHAFNALLKTLEEPPENTVFIFATTEFHKVPATIVSRCQYFEFKKVSKRDLVNHLNAIASKEHLTITDYGLTLIAEASEGSVRDAQSLLDQAVAFCGENIEDRDLKEILGAVNRDLLYEISSAVFGERPDLVFSLVEKIISAGFDLRFFHRELVRHFRNLLVVKSVSRPEDMLAFGSEELQRLAGEAAKASGEELLRYLQALQNAEQSLRFSSNSQIAFETLLVRLCHYKKIASLKDLLRDFGELKKGGGLPGEPDYQANSSFPSDLTADSGGPALPPDQAGGSTTERSASSKRSESIIGKVTGGSSSSKKEPDRDVALKDPGVRSFMDAFKATVVSVRPPKQKTDEEEE